MGITQQTARHNNRAVLHLLDIFNIHSTFFVTPFLIVTSHTFVWILVFIAYRVTLSYMSSVCIHSCFFDFII